jgi:Pyridoxamine 5'-phosphate oxidase
MSVTMERVAAPALHLTGDQVWRELERMSFAVISYVTPTGEPRSSGVVYAIAARRMYVVSAVDSWKAKHIPASGRVALTVPVRRGGMLSLLFPIPPATISFHAKATVRPADALGNGGMPKQLVALVPAERRNACRIIEIEPVGRFLTYGVGVSLTRMRSPRLARARTPVG